MLKTIPWGTGIIAYELQYKKVKNINLRIRPDGTVHVSANRLVPRAVIDDFVLSKADLIIKAQKKYANQPDILQSPYFAEEEIRDVILDLCRKAYPYYEKKGIAYPQIKFRKMVSRWGSCHAIKGVLTFNTNLMYAPLICVEYVVWHEFTHFLQQNHSKKFYEELEKVCPHWKQCRNRLKEIRLR
ncbi:MAG: M48 family metallopeptidase [Ruminococcaceae bacterium]|nr:M48 family metallopeptidase [Oscillospiraceae bacterium]